MSNLRKCTAVLDAVAWAVSEAHPAGPGQQFQIHDQQPVNSEHEINISNLTGIRLYEPEELILQAEASTTMAEIEAALDEKNQQLAFEPMDLGPLLQGEAGAGTLGGVIAETCPGQGAFALVRHGITCWVLMLSPVGGRRSSPAVVS